MPDDSKKPHVPAIADIEAVAQQAEAIYNKQKARLQRTSPGDFAVVDIVSGEIEVSRYPEQAFELAKTRHPGGVYHLIKIGSAAAFHVGYLSSHARRVRAN